MNAADVIQVSCQWLILVLLLVGLGADLHQGRDKSGEWLATGFALSVVFFVLLCAGAFDRIF